jgi:hypothetical protein
MSRLDLGKLPVAGQIGRRCIEQRWRHRRWGIWT